MAPTNRNGSSDLSPFAADEVEEFDFFTLATRLDAYFDDAPPIGSTRAPAEERVRFRASASLGFPPNDIWSITPAPEGVLDVRVNFMGLYGPASPLPPSFTERVMHADGQGATGDFLDFFNHRLIALLFQVLKANRYESRYAEGAIDPMSLAFSALFGAIDAGDTPELRRRRVLLLPYLGMLSLHNRSHRVVAGVIEHFTGLPCRIEEFVTREIEIPREAQMCLGGSVRLGRDMLLGSTVNDVAGHFRVCLGPLTLDRYVDLLPGRRNHEGLADLVALILREPLGWDYALALSPGEAKPWRLGEAELGWTSFVEPPSDRVIEVLV